MAGKENVVQTAITVALQCYCQLPGMPRVELFPPLPVQQGDGLRKFSADLIARLDNCKVILLEIKELDCVKKILMEFRLDQHTKYLQFEEIGVPVGYAYNEISPLPYNVENRSKDWPKLTLEAVRRCAPSLLPGKTPNIQGHGTLLDWLQQVHGEDVSEQVGRIHGAIRKTEDLRNGALVLIYAVEENVLTSLTADQLQRVIDCLGSGSWLSPAIQSRLTKLLGASTKVFDSFKRPPIKKIRKY